MPAPSYLLRLAAPALLVLMGPSSGEGGLPGIRHENIPGVLARVIAQLRLYRGCDGPATLGRVLQVFLEGPVVFFPAVEGFVTEEACDVVGVAGQRLEDESGLGHLQTVDIV